VSRFDAPIEANFTFVNVEEPAEPEEGDTWYNPDTDEAAVWDSNAWQQMNVTQHGSLSGVTEGQHRTDQRVADLAPVQSVEGNTGDVTGLATDSDLSNHAGDAAAHHSRPAGTDQSAPEPMQRIIDIGQGGGSQSVTSVFRPAFDVELRLLDDQSDGSFTEYSFTITFEDGRSRSRTLGGSDLVDETVRLGEGGTIQDAEANKSFGDPTEVYVAAVFPSVPHSHNI